MPTPPAPTAPTVSPALDNVNTARKALTRLAHPSIAGRYPAETRKRLHAALDNARAAVAAVEDVLDTSAGAS